MNPFAVQVEEPTRFLFVVKTIKPDVELLTALIKSENLQVSILI